MLATRIPQRPSAGPKGGIPQLSVPARRVRRRKNPSCYAIDENVSRTTLYKLAHEFQQHFGTARRPGPKGKKKAVTGKAEVAEERKVVITELRMIKSILQMAVSPMSSRDIQQQLQIDFNLKVSQRKIKKIIVFYRTSAGGKLPEMWSKNRYQLFGRDKVTVVGCIPGFLEFRKWTTGHANNDSL